jgi:hypothetical protein
MNREEGVVENMPSYQSDSFGNVMDIFDLEL